MSTYIIKNAFGRYLKKFFFTSPKLSNSGQKPSDFFEILSGRCEMLFGGCEVLCGSFEARRLPGFSLYDRTIDLCSDLVEVNIKEYRTIDLCSDVVEVNIKEYRTIDLCSDLVEVNIKEYRTIDLCSDLVEVNIKEGHRTIDLCSDLVEVNIKEGHRTIDEQLPDHFLNNPSLTISSVQGEFHKKK